MVTIIIPSYNRAHLLGETLDSVLAQTYKNWECIVVDDRSIDATDELMEFYCERDSRIQYHHRPDDRIKGANACRNFAIKLSEGQFVQFLDSDDIISYNKLEEQVTALNRSKAELATCRWGSFGNSKNLRIKTKYYSFRNYLSPWKLLRTFGRKNEYLPPHVYLLSKQLVDRTEGWNENLLINQDGEYFVRIILNANKIVFCKRAAAYYRYGDRIRTSIINNKIKFENAIYSWDLIEQNISNKMKIKPLKIYVENGRKNTLKHFQKSS